MGLTPPQAKVPAAYVCSVTVELKKNNHTEQLSKTRIPLCCLCEYAPLKFSEKLADSRVYSVMKSSCCLLSLPSFANYSFELVSGLPPPSHTVARWPNILHNNLKEAKRKYNLLKKRQYNNTKSFKK